MGKKKGGTATLEEHGHQVNDPDVSGMRERMEELMQSFDNCGIQIVEEEYRNLADEEKTVAVSWLHDRKAGKDRPVPEFLAKYATEQLKVQQGQYQEVQRESRIIKCRCSFGKPSAILPTGDNGEDKIKMTVVIPEADLPRPSVPEEMFVWCRVKVAFTLRALDKWEEQDLPGISNLHEILECETEIKGYHRSKAAYKVSFPISCDLIDDNTAVRSYANRQGSIRFELIGEIKEKEEFVPEPESKPTESTKVAKGQMTLLGTEEVPYNEQIKDEEFISPDEYFVPSQTDGCSAIVYIGIKGDRFFGSRSCNFVDQHEEDQEADWMYPKAAGDSYSSLNAAMIAQIGSLIDYAKEKESCEGFIADLRAELKRIEAGGEPVLMDMTEDEDDVSFE